MGHSKHSTMRRPTLCILWRRVQTPDQSVMLHCDLRQHCFPFGRLVFVVMMQ